MNKFHPNEQLNNVAMDGTSDGIVMRRTPIKLSEGPKIMVAIPVGGKAVSTVLKCPQCKERGEERYTFDVNTGFRPQALVPLQFLLQHMNWLPPLNVTMGYTFKTGMLSAEARQIMTQECKRIETVKYIFYVDDDMVIPPMGLYTLYNFMEQHPEVGAATGVYTTRRNPPEPLVYTKHGRGAEWDFEMGDGAAPAEIMGAGAGCLLARVKAIKDWENENPDTPIWCDSSEFPASNGGRVTWGHDVRFIRNIREAGWKCYVLGDVLCGHYDLQSNSIFSVPTNAPGFKKRNVNTEFYWDAVYGKEGFNTWRTYPEMFDFIVQYAASNKVENILELGCGPGVLGAKLTASNPCKWTGCDISSVAVAQAKARFLDAFVADVRDDVNMEHYDTVIATELLEHLDWNDCKNLLEKINVSDAKKLLFGTPWNCMPPEEVSEHQVLVNQDWVNAVKDVLSNFELDSVNEVDDKHAVTVWCRKE